MVRAIFEYRRRANRKRLWTGHQLCYGRVVSIPWNGVMRSMPRETFQHLPGAIKGLENIDALRDDLRRIDKIAAVSLLASAVAHEIRNPLTAVQWNLQVLKEKHKEDAGLYDVILSELQRMDATMGQILSLAKANETDFQLTNVVELTTTMVNLMSVQANQSNVSLQVDATPVALVECDENQLKQVLINLLANAIDAMQNGGTVHVQLTADGETGVRFTIKDSGVGIPEDILGRIGRPFFTTKPEGTGLGLMISQSIIQTHGGHMNITSTPNQGTTVEFVLPYRQGPRS